MQGLTGRIARQIIQSVGGPGEPPRYGFNYFSAGLDAHKKTIEEDYFKEFIPEGGSNFKMVVGMYGGGKTHFLYSIRELAWRNNLVTAYIALKPGETPLNKLELVYSQIIRALSYPQSPEEVMSGQSEGIESLLTAALQDQRERLLGAGVPATDMDEQLLAWAKGFSRFDSQSFKNAVEHALKALIQDHSEEFDTVCQWLRGEGYVRTVHSKLGILQKIDKTTALPMIRSLVQLTRDLGYAGVVVLLDETEPASSLSGKQMDILLQNLRELIDECANTTLKHTMIFYTVPDENFLEHKGQVYQALTTRLAVVFDHTNPAGVKIMLDDIWSDPVAMLEEIGSKLGDILQVARGVPLDSASVRTRAAEIAAESYKERFGDVGYRRLFVQRMVKALHELATANGVTS